MADILCIVENVTRGAVPAADGANQIADILPLLRRSRSAADRQNYTRAAAAYRLCDSLAQVDKDCDAGWSDVLSNLRQVAIVYGRRIKVDGDLAGRVGAAQRSFGLTMDDSLEVWVEREFPPWLRASSGMIRSVEDLTDRRTDSTVLGDGLLHAALDSATYASPAQKAVVASALAMPPGHTLLACLPTGGGKSLVFQLGAYLSAATQSRKCTVVVVPTVALALDQYSRSRDLLARAGWPEASAAYHGSLSAEDKRSIATRLREGRLSLLFTSPEALIESSLHDSLIDAARCGHLDYIVIDEAHIVMDWGDSFRTSFQMLSPLRRILLRESKGSLRTALLSATLDEETSEGLRRLFSEEHSLVEIRGDMLRPEPCFCLDKPHSRDERFDRILSVIPLLPKPLILYVISPDDADAWKTRIEGNGFRRVACFTGKTPGSERDRLLDLWNGNHLDMMVATSAFGMGVDKPDIRTIVHCCLPESINRFYQEVGRGGRDGLASLSLLSVVPSDCDAAFNLRKSSHLTADSLVKRWSAMRHSGKAASGDTFWLDSAETPPHLEQEITGGRNIGWNKTNLMFLYRHGLIDLLDVKQADDAQGPMFLVHLVEREVLEDPERLMARLTPVRDEERRQIVQELEAMKELVNRPKRSCWSQRIRGVYPLAYPVCGGCPACRVGDDSQLLLGTFTQQPYVPDRHDIRTPGLRGCIGQWLAGRRELLLSPIKPAEIRTARGLGDLMTTCLESGIRHLVVAESFDRTTWHDAFSLLPQDGLGIHFVWELDELWESSRGILFGPVALLYPAETGLVQRSYKWATGYMNETTANSVIHIAPVDTYIASERRQLKDLVNGLVYDI